VAGSIGVWCIKLVDIIYVQLAFGLFCGAIMWRIIMKIIRKRKAAKIQEPKPEEKKPDEPKP
jgi:hypothetical protein